MWPNKKYKEIDLGGFLAEQENTPNTWFDQRQTRNSPKLMVWRRGPEILEEEGFGNGLELDGSCVLKVATRRLTSGVRIVGCSCLVRVVGA